ncbi:MAG: hypothetical protein Q7U47_14370 [Paludibacter sp.]|nr:hypothetical protein [Paludibacter sp.]
MKLNRILFTALMMLISFSCGIYCPSISKPLDFQLLDWNNYNDVKTVDWNTHEYCSDTKIWELDKKHIKVYGWIFHGSHNKTVPYWDFYLINDSIYMYEPNTIKTTSIRVICFNQEELNRLKNKFDTTDLTKKCYVRGKLNISCLETMGCSVTAGGVIIESADSIFFEK